MASLSEEPPMYSKAERPKKARAEKPRKRQTSPQAQTPVKSEIKHSLSEQLGGGLAQALMSPAKDIDSLNIIQRLQLLKQEAQLESKFHNFNESSTTLMTTSITSQALLSPDDHNPSHHHQVSTSITVSLASASTTSVNHLAPYPKRKRNDIHTFTLHDFTAISALGSLVERYGKVSHMGVLDPSYQFFMTTDRRAALYYKVHNNIAVVGGDPLCDPADYCRILEEFRDMRKRRRWGIVFIGATEDFARYAQKQKWVTMQFGTERVLNPLTNPVLHEKEQKRLLVQNRQLLDHEKGGISVHAYAPAQSRDEALEEKLRIVYDSWRESRNHNGQPQAYMTVFDPFSIPTLMTYIYTTDRQGECNGFAALRKIGANRGYHIDPYCAAPGAPKGITDLLVFSAMALLQQAEVEYLSLGFEPTIILGEVTGLSRFTSTLTKSCYSRAFRHLPIGGKKAYHDKFRPDPALDSGLYIIYPDGTPSLQDALATLHFANIEVSGLLRQEWFGLGKSKKTTDGKQAEVKGASISNSS